MPVLGARSVLTVLLVTVASCLAACSTRAETLPLQTALDRQLALNARRHGIAGQAVLIIGNGAVVYRGSHGLASRETNRPARPDDVFSAYSVSKLFANVLVMQLVEQGKLDLEEPIGPYVPDLPAHWKDLKVAEILNHVSGLPEYFDASRTPITAPPARQAALAQLADKPALFPPGTETRYTQTNFILIGAILEAKYKQSYRDIVTERIVKPLALHDTYFGTSHVPENKLVGSYIGKDHQLVIDPFVDWPEYAIVHAELFTTVDDLGTFLTAVIDGRLIQRATLHKLWTPYRYKQGGASWFAAGWDYGTTGKYRYVGHDGGTKVRVRLVFDEAFQDTYAVAYLTNGSAENVWSSTLVESVMAVVAPGKFGH